MGKYIIELDDEYVSPDNELIVSHKNLFDGDSYSYHVQIAKLTPYTEPDMGQIRKEAYEDGYKTAKVQCNIQAEKDMREVGERHYQRGYETAKHECEACRKVRADAEQKLADKAYQSGLNDAWAAARKIALMDTETSENVTGYFGLFRIMENLTPMQAIEKIRKYEQEKEEQIQVGDEVKCIRAGWTAIVTKIREDGHLTLMGNDGAIANGYDEKDFIKTGRHFPEIAEVLRKMKENSDG